MTHLPALRHIPLLAGFLRSCGVASLLYYLVFATAVTLFCFLYVSIIFNPNEAADNLRRYGGFIAGLGRAARLGDISMKC